MSTFDQDRAAIAAFLATRKVAVCPPAAALNVWRASRLSWTRGRVREAVCGGVR